MQKTQKPGCSCCGRCISLVSSALVHNRSNKINPFLHIIIYVRIQVGGSSNREKAKRKNLPLGARMNVARRRKGQKKRH